MGYPEFKCTCPVITKHVRIEGPYLNLRCLRTGNGTAGGRLWPTAEPDRDYITWWASFMGTDGPLRRKGYYYLADPFKQQSIK
jgi:hypothetical protein